MRKRQNSYKLSSLPSSFYRNKDKKELPQHICKTCSKCFSGLCLFYERPVNPYNRCFNHSNYHTVTTRYQEPSQLKDIKEEYERKKNA